MPEHDVLGAAIVGCGDIARRYAEGLVAQPDKVRFVGGYDVVADRAKQFVATHGGRAYETYDDLLGDDDVDLVVNLTIQQEHANVSRRALEAGKHVHSEKPLACTRDDGKLLLRLAEDNHVRLSCAPFTFMGEAQQTFIKAAQQQAIGQPLVAYSEMDWGAIERWHVRPEPFYAAGAGPLLDVGVYALTVLTAALGPVRRVTGFAQIVQAERVIGDGPDQGKRFRVETPDQVIGGLEFECGTVGRITASFRTGKSKHANGTEFHGEGGSLFIEANTSFNAAVERYDLDAKEWTPVPYIREPFQGVEWGRAVFDLVDCLRTGQTQHCTGQQAYHVLDICLSILESAEQGRALDVQSRFTRPALMPWAE